MRRHLEDSHQVALMNWAKLLTILVDGEPTTLGEYLFAIPNGGRRDKREAARLKRSGVKAGVLDLNLPIKDRTGATLWVEMKAPKPHDARVTQSQRDWITKMRRLGHRAEVCYGWDDARELIMSHLKRAGCIA